MSLKVCVIGAGAAGLCAARHLARHPDRFHPIVVYESSGVIGGTWVFTEDVGNDSLGHPIHSSMYRNMRTNLPKEVMAFPDFPFAAQEEESFLHHSKIRQYLEDYCQHFSLGSLIRLQTRVDLVEPIFDTIITRTRWKVRSSSSSSSSDILEEDVFDAVLVCNGHYFAPHFAPIENLEAFEGQVMHSHSYRGPLDLGHALLRLKSIAVMGGGASGIDIGIEISEVADTVFLCHNNPTLNSQLPRNMRQVRGIERCSGPRLFALNDGTEISVDVLLFCTGYDYSFPFLADTCGVTVENRQVRPLYKHVINARHPSMAFIGIPTLVCPFPLFDLQVQWFLSAFGIISLPTEAEMSADIDRERRELAEAGVAERHFHRMGVLQWEYGRDLARRAGVPEVPGRVINLYNKVHETRKKRLMAYKDDKFVMNDEGEYACGTK